jgi:hypothetical protein
MAIVGLTWPKRFMAEAESNVLSLAVAKVFAIAGLHHCLRRRSWQYAPPHFRRLDMIVMPVNPPRNAKHMDQLQAIGTRQALPLD